MRSLARVERDGIAMVGNLDGRVAFGFTERAGGVSEPPYDSLNLGAHVGDNPAAVAENRRRVLAALDAEEYSCNLLVPNQVHGDEVAVVRTADADELDHVRTQVSEGADAIVCLAPGVPVLLCFADCVPVVIIGEHGFAVVHSGWKGTYAGIAGKAARILAGELSCDPATLKAYIGPHILGSEYEVSAELIDKFAALYPASVRPGSRLLDLSAAIRSSLVEAGVGEQSVFDTGLSTLSGTDRFYSYRGEGGTCGRHGAVAVMRSQQPGWRPFMLR